MKPTLETGTEYIHHYVVPKNKTVPYVFEETEMFQAMPGVFATAFLVGLIEWTCMEALKPHMEEGEITLGTNICVSHLAPTPPGMKVEVRVKCLEASGPKTKWSVAVMDEKDLISEGTHERFAVKAEKFARIVEKKSA